MRSKFEVLALGFTFVAISACDILATGGLCGNEVMQTVISPSGKLKAVVFFRDCAATTGFNTQVSIIRAAELLPDDGGNSLILDGTVPLKVEWRSNSLLRIGGVGDERVFRQSASEAGVAIIYGD